MKKKEIIFQIVDILESQFPNFDVRTPGGDGQVDLPAIVVEYSTHRRSEYQGTNPTGGTTTDEEGNLNGVILQRYYQMDLNIEVKSYDEEERDDTLSDIQDTFSTFEWDSDKFHPDTFEWEVGDTSPRNNPVIEPDWYEAGLVVGLRFVEETVYDDLDTIESIQKNVDNN